VEMSMMVNGMKVSDVVWVNLLMPMETDLQELLNMIRNMGKGHTFIRMETPMLVDGTWTHAMARVHIHLLMVSGIMGTMT